MSASLVLRPLVEVDYGRVNVARYARMLKDLKKGQGLHNAVEMATELKDRLRTKYFRIETQFQPNSFKEARVRSRRFWKMYELVNRVLNEYDPVYSIINSGTALSTTADNLTFEAAAAGQVRLLEIILGGEATSSAVNRIVMQRAGTSITGNTVITPEKFNTRSPAAAGVYGKAGTQALAGNPLISWALNAFGGFVRWVAQPGEEAYCVNSEVISVRSASGTSVISSTGVFEEL